MVHETIQEQIAVEVAFLHNKVLPRKFLWGSRVYEVKKVTMVHEEKQGNDKLYYFSVTDGINFFRLEFSTRDLSWVLSELYSE